MKIKQKSTSFSLKMMIIGENCHSWISRFTQMVIIEITFALDSQKYLSSNITNVHLLHFNYKWSIQNLDFLETVRLSVTFTYIFQGINRSPCPKGKKRVAGICVVDKGSNFEFFRWWLKNNHIDLNFEIKFEEIHIKIWQARHILFFYIALLFSQIALSVDSKNLKCLPSF